jgi:hypothetical protein
MEMADHIFSEAQGSSNVWAEEGNR